MKTTANPSLLLMCALGLFSIGCGSDAKDSGDVDGGSDDGGSDDGGSDDGGSDDGGSDDGGSDDGGGDDGGGDDGGSDDGEGRVRIAHFGVFPGDTGTEVDIWAEGANTGLSLGFKEVTGYVPLPEGAYDLAVVPSGAELSGAVWSVDDFPIADGDSWSIFAAGNVSGDDSSFNVFAFPEDRSEIASGEVRVNVVHAAALGVLNPVDVWVADAMCQPAGDGPLLPGFEFGAFATVDLPSTQIGVAFDVGGDGTVDACFQIPATVTDEIVNVYAVNTDAGVISLIAQLPDNTTAEIMPTAL